MKRKNVVKIVALSIVLGIATLFGIQANALTFERAMTWIHVGDKWTPSQMMLVRIELKEPTSYESMKYSGPQTAQELMNAFNESYNHKHLRTIVSAFPKASSVEIKPEKAKQRNTWSKLLLQKGISSSFTITEIDTRYPRHAWLNLLLEKGITINYLFDYLYCMADRYQLAFLEDHPELWKAGIQGIPPLDNWNNYKAAYLEELVKDYNLHRHFVAEVVVTKTTAKTQLETTRARIAASKARVAAANARIKAKKEATKNSRQNSVPKTLHVPIVPRVPQPFNHLMELEEMTLPSLQRLVNQLEQTAENLERQNRRKAAAEVKEALEHAKKALEQMKTEKPAPTNQPKRNMNKKSPYPPL